MKKFFCLAILCCYFNSYAQNPGTIKVTTKTNELIFKVGNNKRIYQSYLGAKLADEGYSDKRFESYPSGGMDFEFEPAVRVVHADGNPSLELRYQKHTAVTNTDGSVKTEIFLKDEVYQTEVILHYLSFPQQDVIKAWTSIKNAEQKEILLTSYASAMLHFSDDNYWLTQFNGDWAKEMRMQEHPLTSGIKIIDSKLGTRAHKYQSPHFFLTPGNNPSTEDSGALIAATLAWTGNFKLTFEIDNKNQLHVGAGINNYASEYHLKSGETFITPALIFTYSNAGKGLASRNLHDWARKFGILEGEKPRLTLLNNWEATGFKFDQNKLVSLFDDAKKLDVDMFLLDDGWFGEKYPRDNDKSSLGDWNVDKKKLPDGVPYLVKSATEKGIKFGIWIEPEMVSPKSELYEKHPDWILKLPNRTENYQRNQLVLDLTNPKVQDFVFKVVDDLFTQNPNLAYIKWDANRTVTNGFAPYLKFNQSHLYIAYTQGLYAVLDRIRTKYPTLPIMLCSGGGGRVDYGAMKYFTEFWPSDNTDGLERIYIQWGYSYFFPANTIAAHITSWGKQSLKFRTDVAMMDKMGYDINVSELTKDEVLFSQQAVANYKIFSPIVAQGDMYRLASPYEGNRAVAMYVDQAKSKAVLFAYLLDSRYREVFMPIKLQGLDPLKKYKIRELNLMPNTKSALTANDKTYTGEYLMKIGIETNKVNVDPLTSVVLEVNAVN
jgi:alpha-galactosidase